MDIILYLSRLKIVAFIKKWGLLDLLLGIIDIFAIALAFQCLYFVNYFDEGGIFLKNRDLLFLFLGILPFL